MFEFIEHGRICEIRMAHPPVNAIGPEFMDGLTSALEEKASHYRAIVLSGQPGMFSAGLDVVRLMQLDHEQVERFWRQFFRLLQTIGASPVPIASAITGHCPAGGAVMTIHGDYRVMSHGNYKIGLNEVQVGLVVPPHIQRVLIRLVGKHRAERLMVAGELLSPEQALEIGFVDELADGPEDTVERAVDWCKKHTALPRSAMSQTRSLMRQDLATNYDDLTQEDVDLFTGVWFSDETQAVMRQVLERLGK
ncbi:MAG TPA: enoyl-CoA hydratase/isomerase family protein [Xanthomonadales bacterium]|nr:enoyl-CoA hydratase/isomerase family protein [Xanthomonadales bacterium]